MYFVVAITALGGAVWFGMWFLFRRRLRRVSTNELKASVYSSPEEYFSFIGNDRASVNRFRELVRSQDLGSLFTEWPDLQRDFRAAEVAAGHAGRPLIMDYFLDYRAHVKELMRRERK